MSNMALVLAAVLFGGSSGEIVSVADSESARVVTYEAKGGGKDKKASKATVKLNSKTKIVFKDMELSERKIAAGYGIKVVSFQEGTTDVAAEVEITKPVKKETDDRNRNRDDRKIPRVPGVKW